MSDRSVLITGCASGIGRCAALTLKRRGWRVLATCRSGDDVAGLEADGLEAFVLDYADPESVAGGADRASELTGGRLTGLVNNGAFALPGPLEDVPREGLRAVFEANVLGPHDLTRRLLPALRASGDGRIVNISSVLGLQALRFRGAYVASKFALEGLTDSLRLELQGPDAPTPRVRVVTIEPGPVKTQIRLKSQRWYERFVDKTGTAWSDAYAKIEDRLYADEPDELARFELPPDAVVRRIVTALESGSPAPRYFTNVQTWGASALRRLLPTRVLDRVYRDQ